MVEPRIKRPEEFVISWEGSLLRLFQPFRIRTYMRKVNGRQHSPDVTWNPSHIAPWQGENAVGRVFCTD